ncbi:MAG: type fimbrial biosis protein FimT [Paraburkholderia sp.]|nr:type fimbrial biosis protein FimT [Paraburkholderia sp.]
MRGHSRLLIEYGKRARRCRGFTFFEMVVVVALVALLAAMAAPSFVTWHLRDRVDAGARALLASLAYARSEAVRRGEPVTVCRIDADGRCIEARGRHDAGAANWASGWAVVVEAGAGRTVLRRQSRAEAIQILGSAAEIRFTPPAGQVIGGFRSFNVAPESVAPPVGGFNRSRCIAIAAGGRARTVAGACRRSS